MFSTSSTKERKNLVLFIISKGNGELEHKCFTKHSLMGTARMEQDRVTDEEGKKRGLSMERSIADKSERTPD